MKGNLDMVSAYPSSQHPAILMYSIFIKYGMSKKYLDLGDPNATGPAAIMYK